MNREVMQMVRDALGTLYMDAEGGQAFDWNQCRNAVEALDVELAKPEPEPTAWMHHISDNDDREHYVLDFEPAHGMSVYGGDIGLYRREDL